MFDAIDERCWFTPKIISCVIDEHAPIKEKKPLKNTVPFMNNQLRKAYHRNHRKAIHQNRYGKMVDRNKTGKPTANAEMYQQNWRRNVCNTISILNERILIYDECVQGVFSQYDNQEEHKLLPKTPFISMKSVENIWFKLLGGKTDAGFDNMHVYLFKPPLKSSHCQKGISLIKNVTQNSPLAWTYLE